MTNENRDRESRRENPGRSQQPPDRASRGEGKKSTGSGSPGQPGSGGNMSREDTRKKRPGGSGSQEENQENE